MDGPTKVTKWLKKKGWSQLRLAAHIGVSGPTVCQWTTGTRRPSYEVAARLEGITGGAITLDDWVDRSRVA